MSFRYNEKTVKVDEILWEENPTMTFKKSDGSEISYVEYYQQHYNCQIVCLQQPLLVNLSYSMDVDSYKLIS